MGYLLITEDLVKKLKPFFKQHFKNRATVTNIQAWHKNRFIQLATAIEDMEIHYEYYQGYVELHLEGEYSCNSNNYIWRQIVEKSNNYEGIGWHRWHGRNQGRCRIELIINDICELTKAFIRLSEIFDPIISQIIGKVSNNDFQVDKELPDLDKMKVDELSYGIVFVKDIPFNNLIIPEYQRPYKWKPKNVNQLINDIIAFKDKKEYRLGTLVLHENNIVDGQQRIITLSLIIRYFLEVPEILKDNQFQETLSNLDTFWKRIKFNNQYSIANVRENIEAISERKEDLDGDFFKFLLYKCQFVIVQLPKITEAFQFFDSQNARGKDLEPHDLLKAFHLREITSFTEHDSKNISTWQNQNTSILVNLFLTMYRVKRWTKGKQGRAFTKNNISTFKGITLNNNKNYPFYLQQIICHYFSNTYSSDTTRQIDRSEMNFPFQLDQICVNGSRFFDMVRHYDSLYKKIRDFKTFEQYDDKNNKKTAMNIIKFLNTYPNHQRRGDEHVRSFFDCLLLYYIDRFGFNEINKATWKIFKYVYRLRLKNFSVQFSTVDNEAKQGNLFRTIRDAMSPYDILNSSYEILEQDMNARNAVKELKSFYYND